MTSHIRLLLLTAACLLALTACEKTKPPSVSVLDPPAASGSAPETQPDGSSQPQEPEKLTKTEARRLLAEDIDTAEYMILDASTKTTVNGEDYHVFIVAGRADNKPVGQVAVSTKTGEKYNYTGEGTLGAYAEFSLYDTQAGIVYNWEGFFSDGSSTIELLPMDDSAFEYHIGEDMTGIAYIDGNTAEDEVNGQTFTFDAEGNLTLAGKAEGIFSPAS